jgi:hypothetical protein
MSFFTSCLVKTWTIPLPWNLTKESSQSVILEETEESMHEIKSLLLVM